MTHSLILERFNTTVESPVPIPEKLREIVQELGGRAVEGGPDWGGSDTLRMEVASADSWGRFLGELVALDRIAHNTDASDTEEAWDEIIDSLNDRPETSCRE